MSGWVCEEIVKRSSDLVSRRVEHGGWRGESGADSFHQHPLILLKPSSPGQMAHAGERNAGNGDVRLHPLGLPVERQPYLEVALRDLGDILDTAIIQRINFASCGEGQ